jgi:hypothetical protein
MNPDNVAQAQAQAQMQAQQAQQGQVGPQGLGTPPPPKFEYTPNAVAKPGEELMRQNIADQMQKKADSKSQEAMALQAKADQIGGFAGYKSDPSAVQPQGPNGDWQPSSPEAHQLNIRLAEKIKDGTIDPQTAALAMQHPEVAPEIKQALAQIAQQGGFAGQQQQQAPQGQPAGLGQMEAPQPPQDAGQQPQQ